MVQRYSSPESAKDGIVFFMAKVGFWQLMKAISAQNILVLKQGVSAGTAYPRKKQRKKIIQIGDFG